MLTELVINDFAIIDKLELTLSPNFNVLTGETGAGKSIIIDAVGLLLGGRADTVMIRAEADRALVEGTFRLEAATRETIDPLLVENGLESDEPDVLVLAREVRRNGRNVCRVNGRAVALTVLKEIGQYLIDIHGQSEHLSLLRVREHVNLLDRYAGLWEQRAQFAQLVARLRAVRHELDELLRDERELARRADLLKFQIEEIGAARLKAGEDAELEQEHARLAHAEHLAQLADEAYTLLYGGDETSAVLDKLAQVNRALSGLVKIDPTLNQLARAVEEAGYVLEDAARTIHTYREQIEFSPRRLEQLEERLDLIKRLKRKYGQSIQDILKFAQDAAAELDGISHRDERIGELRQQEDELLREIGRQGQALSQARRAAAQNLAAQIEAELEDLRMAGARFGVSIAWKADANGAYADDPPPDSSLQPHEREAGRYAFDATGLDVIEFLVAPNVGEGLRPLARIASGGETSRLMLALKTVLARADRTPTLIFDEIDQGIGGRVGAVVGRKLWGLTQARSAVAHQVICITHLPQLAGYGDAHFKVEKRVMGNRTVAHVTRLNKKARIREMAQMLGASGEGAVQSAQEILEAVQAEKGDRGTRRQGDRETG